MSPRMLRRIGIVPAVIYGHGFQSRSLQSPYKAIAHLVRFAGTNHLVALGVEGESDGELVLIREVQRDPVTNHILHVDFYRIVAGQRIRSAIPLVQQGEAPVTEEGGIVNQVLEALEIECLPRDLPGSVAIDLSNLVSFRSRLTVADLVIPQGVTVLTPASAEVAGVVAPRKLEVEEVEEIGEIEGEEIEGVAGIPIEGEAPAEEGEERTSRASSER